MKAVRLTKYGPPEVLQIEDIEKPVPKNHQVLINVHAASINAGDWRGMRADPILIRIMGGGLLKPKDPRFGSDVAGIVEAVCAADIVWKEHYSRISNTCGTF